MDDQEDIFPNLPPEIILNILSRIPINTVFTCKCVCKSWLELLESPGFARSHLSNSVPGLLIHHLNDTNDTDIFKIFGFEDSLEIAHYELHYKRVLELKSDNIFGDSSPLITHIDGSANGLLFIRNSSPDPDDYYICNPITHECLNLPKPERIPGDDTVFAHGFGVSRLSNQYKVVMISHDLVCDPGIGLRRSIQEIVCEVYTLGTGSWRNVTAPREMLLDYCSTGKLLNGNLHWLTVDSIGALWISRFDIVFIKFRAPTVESEGPPIELGVLRDRLCVSEISPMNEIVIYLMTDDGYEKESWSKEHVIREIVPGVSIDAICVLKGFGDGDCLLCYSSRTETVALVDVLTVEFFKGYSQATLFIPSFISLKDFKTETAELFEFVCSMS